MSRWSRFEPAADRRLVKGLSAGNDGALAKIYDIYAERLYDYSWSRLGETRTASDVVHDTLIDAYRRAGRLRDRERLRAWLYAAARRRCIQQGRGAAPMRWDCAVASGAAIGLEEIAKGAPPEELCQRVQKAFQKLSLGDQEALFLALRHDLDAADLEVILGEPQRRVHSRLARGRVWLTHAAPISSVSRGLDLHQAPKMPANLRHRVLHAASDPELAGYRADIVARAGGLSPDGFPRQPGSRVPLKRRWLFAGSGLGAAVTCVAAMLLVVGSSAGGAGPFQGKPRPRPSKSLPSIGVQPNDQTPRHQGGGDSRRGDSARNGASASASPTDSSAPPQQDPQRPPPVAGELTIEPTQLDFTGRDEAVVLLRAEDGAVSWTAFEDESVVSLSREQGTVPAGGEMTVRIQVNKALIQLPDRVPVTFVEDAGNSASKGGGARAFTGSAVSVGGGRTHTVWVSWPLGLHLL
jgi:RNA polymerase sigma factor (sigma-70 family)